MCISLRAPDPQRTLAEASHEHASRKDGLAGGQLLTHETRDPNH